MGKFKTEEERKKIFGKNLERLREKRGLLQKELAEKLELKPNSISNYENGKSFPTVPVLLRIAEYFKVSTEYLLSESKMMGEENAFKTVEQHKNFLKDVLDNISEEEILEKYDFGELFENLPLDQKKKVLNSIELEYFKMNKKNN